MNVNDFMFGHHAQAAAASGRFNQKFNVLGMGLSGKSGLEAGGKILLPPSALNTLSRLNIQYPMLFEISNEDKHRSSHCGIQEFSAEEGVCYMPRWMMENLHLRDNDVVSIKSTSLNRGTFVKIQPHSSSFTEISNPKAVLENALRKFATLTKAEDFVIEYNKNKYYLRVVDIKPANPSNAISIIETDISVDFAPPLDAKESTSPSQQSGGGGGSFGGLTFGGSQPIGIGNNNNKNTKKNDSDSDDSDSDDSDSDDTPKFKAFGGSGARLDGKVGTPPKSMLGTSPKPSSSPSTTTTSTPPNSSSSNSKFSAFQGKGRSLKD